MPDTDCHLKVSIIKLHVRQPAEVTSAVIQNFPVDYSLDAAGVTPKKTTLVRIACRQRTAPGGNLLIDNYENQFIYMYSVCYAG